MARRFLTLGIAAVLSSLAPAQTTFEVTEVQVSPPARNPCMRGRMVHHGLYEIRFATMLDLVRTAYGVEAERVLGGPNWLEQNTLDVIAKLPWGGTIETAEPLLKGLVEGGFQLAVPKH